MIFLCNLPWERCVFARFTVFTPDATAIPPFITSALIYCVQLRYLYKHELRTLLSSWGLDWGSAGWWRQWVWAIRHWAVALKEVTGGWDDILSCFQVCKYAHTVNVQSKDNQIWILHWDVSADIIEICLFILWRHLEHYLLHCTPTDSQDPLLFSRMSFKKGKLQGKVSQTSKCLWITSDG